jgi:hypothetical protein
MKVSSIVKNFLIGVGIIYFNQLVAMTVPPGTPMPYLKAVTIKGLPTGTPVQLTYQLSTAAYHQLRLGKNEFYSLMRNPASGKEDFMPNQSTVTIQKVDTNLFENLVLKPSNICLVGFMYQTLSFLWTWRLNQPEELAIVGVSNNPGSDTDYIVMLDTKLLFDNLNAMCVKYKQGPVAKVWEYYLSITVWGFPNGLDTPITIDSIEFIVDPPCPSRMRSGPNPCLPPQLYTLTGQQIKDFKNDIITESTLIPDDYRNRAEGSKNPPCKQPAS